MRIALWLAAVEPTAMQAEAAPDGWLTEAEQRRLKDFRHSARARQFLAGRWLLRHLLVAEHGGTAHEWQLDGGERRAPAVIAGPQGFTGRLGLAHSGERVLAAVAPGAFGVDLEARKRRFADLDAFMRFALTPAECDDCAAMPAAERGARVLMHWSAKEAFGKGQGSGLPFEALQRIEALPAGADRDANACIGFRKAQDGGDHVIAVWAGDRVLPQLHWHGGAEEAAVFRWSDWCVVGRD